MKILQFGLFLLATTAVATAMSLRQARDVSELSVAAYNYLPPQERLAPLPEVETEIEPIVETTLAPEIATDAPQPTTIAPSPSPSPSLSPSSSVRSADGYEYRTVRRLKYRYRTQRDVSHLFGAQTPDHQQYLPPQPSPPQHEYLPSQASVNSIDSNDDSEIVEAPVGDYLPLASTEAPELETDLQTEAAATEAPQDSAILAADGYHYKQPEVPFEIEAQPKSGEYLPPLEQGVVEAEGLEGGESATLADDGYHYRVIKRFRF